MQSVTILGSTGSVGQNTLRVIDDHRDRFKIRGLAAGSNLETLRSQIEAFSPEAVYLEDERAAAQLRKTAPRGVKIFSNSDGLRGFSSMLDSDILVAATTGTTALLAVMDALERGKKVALANKEILVVAGGLVMEALAKSARLPAGRQASLVPVDSEHSAIFQCLHGNSKGSVAKIILTGTGGPLREVPVEELSGISKAVVTSHPRWKMGEKITVDSATLMNKGLEIIEASWLFDLAIDKIEVLIHPEAVIHSMVEFKDGSVLAQLGVTDMRLPILVALGFPERLDSVSTPRLDFHEIKSLTFQPPDRKKFPCLGLAVEAAKKAGSAPCVLSAADEVAVNAYLKDQIHFLDIPAVIEKVLSHHRHVPEPQLHEIQSIHQWAIDETTKLCTPGVHKRLI